MKRYKIYLDVTGTIGHIGSDLAGIGVEGVSEFAHSDTLFSAILHGLSHVYEKEVLNNLLNMFNVEPEEGKEDLLPFRCSSAFLSNKKIDFVPRPLCSPPFNQDIPGLNKLRFISYQNLLKWLGINQMSWTDDAVKDYVDELIDTDAKTYSNLFINRVRAVNAKGRIRNSTQVYHRGEVVYGESTFLYFWIDVHVDWWPYIQKSLEYLTNCAGIGGDFSIGFSELKGFTALEDTIMNHSNPDYYYLLSLFPLDDNIEYHASFYDILNRKSWTNSPYINVIYKKRTVKMLREGSCIKTNAPNGQLIDVTPKVWNEYKDNPNWHQFHRNGLGFIIGYKENKS